MITTLITTLPPSSSSPRSLIVIHVSAKLKMKTTHLACLIIMIIILILITIITILFITMITNQCSRWRPPTLPASSCRSQAHAVSWCRPRHGGSFGLKTMTTKMMKWVPLTRLPVRPLLLLHRLLSRRPHRRHLSQPRLAKYQSNLLHLSIWSPIQPLSNNFHPTNYQSLYFP